MPVTPTYPGVYIEEVPSGVRTITGASTSVTAFVGRAFRGPVDKPITIFNYGDYERTFGGLWKDSAMSVAVKDFFLNGGGEAVIVRLYRSYSSVEKKAADDAAQAAADAVSAAVADQDADLNQKITDADAVIAALSDPHEIAAANFVANAVKALDITATDAATMNSAAAQAATTALTDSVVVKAIKDFLEDENQTKALLKDDGNKLTLEAVNPGAWGNKLKMRITHSESDVKKFNLSILDGNSGVIENYYDLTIDAGEAKSVDKVLENRSKLVRMQGTTLPSVRPAKNGELTTEDGDLWVDNTPTTCCKVATADEAIDGDPLESDDFIGNGKMGAKLGLYALENVDNFNLLCIPPYKSNGDADTTVINKATAYCEKRRAFHIVDSPIAWDTNTSSDFKSSTLGDSFTKSANASVFYPRIKRANPLNNDTVESFSSCGAVAGLYARTDSARGIWKAPAGIDAALKNAPELSVKLSDDENGVINPLGINCLRDKPPFGRIVWGSRTMLGDDDLSSEWKYAPVRRLALYIEESLFKGTQWIVFEPNDEPLWSQIRLSIGSFMQDLFRKGAFQGTSPKDAYFVKCDAETNPQDEIDLGKVNIVVGFAPLKPAEFVIIKLQQIVGQSN